MIYYSNFQKELTEKENMPMLWPQTGYGYCRCEFCRSHRYKWESHSSLRHFLAFLKSENFNCPKAQNPEGKTHNPLYYILQILKFSKFKKFCSLDLAASNHFTKKKRHIPICFFLNTRKCLSNYGKIMEDYFQRKISWWGRFWTWLWNTF